jgi:ribonuclease R
VVVEIMKWRKNDMSPTGKVIEILGKPGEHETEIKTIIKNHELPLEFPTKVEEYAKKINKQISKKEIDKRRDVRETLTFTIDPEDAKDFDDAISFKEIDKEIYEIGVHIADVGYYVERNSILDKEAFNRATSIYLVDRVVPMLPEILSNKVCSLRPQEEKYTFSAIFKINNKGEILEEWFGKTVIKSDRRFSYAEAQEIIETKKGKISKEIALNKKSYEATKEMVNAIVILNEIASTIREERKKQGSINFNKKEIKFKLDSLKNPIEVIFKENKEANKLIEEFMLLANKKVAELFKKAKKEPGVYRIHDAPDNEKLKVLKTIVKEFGYSLDISSREGISRTLNKLLKDVKGKKEQNLIETLAIRSMSKAEYSTQNIGHYGLAFKHYTHFTSPIRRYPDILVHRLLNECLNKESRQTLKELSGKCKYCSEKETTAIKAERDSIKYMQIKYMEDKKEIEYKGFISGITDWGLYIELEENKCEGMVYRRDIKGDRFVFKEEEQALIGRETEKKYRLGDEVLVMVKKTNLIKKHLDFIII